PHDRRRRMVRHPGAGRRHDRDRREIELIGLFPITRLYSRVDQSDLIPGCCWSPCHSLHDTTPNSGRGGSGSMEMYSKKFPSGSSKNTDATVIQAKTIGSSIGSLRPPKGVMPANRSSWGAAKTSSSFT